MDNTKKYKIQEMIKSLEKMGEEIVAIAEEEDRKREGYGKIHMEYDETYEMVESLYDSVREISEGKIALERALYFSNRC